MRLSLVTLVCTSLVLLHEVRATIENCENSSGSGMSEICTKCKQGYYVSMSQTSCLQCRPGCAICASGTDCSSCFANYYKNTTTSPPECVICQPYMCTSCPDGPTKCTACFTAHDLKTVDGKQVCDLNEKKVLVIVLATVIPGVVCCILICVCCYCWCKKRTAQGKAHGNSNQGAQMTNTAQPMPNNSQPVYTPLAQPGYAGPNPGFQGQPAMSFSNPQGFPGPQPGYSPPGQGFAGQGYPTQAFPQGNYPPGQYR